MMKNFVKQLTAIKPFLIILTSLTILMGSDLTQASLVVIANPKSPINQVTQQQLAALYLGRSTNSKVTAYDLPSNTPSYRSFYQTILGWSAAQVSAYWADQIFSGLSNEQPSTVEDAETAIHKVAQSPNVIAYVDSDALKNVGHTVKVIYGNYVIPDPVPVQPSQQNTTRLYSTSSTNGYMSADSKDNDSAQIQATHDSTSDSDLASNSNSDSDSDSNSSLNADTDVKQPPHATQDNLWTLIAKNSVMNHASDRAAVRHWITWFQAHPEVLNRWARNARPYIAYVYRQVQQHHLPAEFALLPMIESEYNPHAYSRTGAAGLWQMMPGTGASYRIEMSWWYDARRDIMTSTQSALDFISTLHRSTDSWELTAAAYNAGLGTVQTAIHRNHDQGQPTDFWSLHLPKETLLYVPKWLALAAIVTQPAHYGLTLPPISSQPTFSSVTLTSQMDLGEIAELSNVDIPRLKALNPGMTRFSTAPYGQFRLLLPTQSLANFQSHMNHVRGTTHVSWQYHEVQASETLSNIARNAHTSVAQLQEVNQLTANYIEPGKGILVPMHLNHSYAALSSDQDIERDTADDTSAHPKKPESILPVATAVPIVATQQDTSAITATASATAEVEKPIESSDALPTLLNKLYGTNA